MKDRITLTDELGIEQEFIILATFGLDDDDYAALLPAENLDSPTYILRLEKDINGDMFFSGIEDEEELNDAIAAYEEIQRDQIQ